MISKRKPSRVARQLPFPVIPSIESNIVLAAMSCSQSLFLCDAEWVMKKAARKKAIRDKAAREGDGSAVGRSVVCTFSFFIHPWYHYMSAHTLYLRYRWKKFAPNAGIIKPLFTRCSCVQQMKARRSFMNVLIVSINGGRITRSTTVGIGLFVDTSWINSLEAYIYSING